MFVSKLMVEDPATHRLVYSKNRVVAFHIRPPYMGGSTGHDAGWDAFHAETAELQHRDDIQHLHSRNSVTRRGAGRVKITAGNKT